MFESEFSEWLRLLSLLLLFCQFLNSANSDSDIDFENGRVNDVLRFRRCTKKTVQRPT